MNNIYVKLKTFFSAVKLKLSIEKTWGVPQVYVEKWNPKQQRNQLCPKQIETVTMQVAVEVDDIEERTVGVNHGSLTLTVNRRFKPNGKEIRKGDQMRHYMQNQNGKDILIFEPIPTQ